MTSPGPDVSPALERLFISRGEFLRKPSARGLAAVAAYVSYLPRAASHSRRLDRSRHGPSRSRCQASRAALNRRHRPLAAAASRSYRISRRRPAGSLEFYPPFSRCYQGKAFQKPRHRMACPNATLNALASSTFSTASASGANVG